MISVDELHEYAKGKVQQAAPAMKPEIYAVKEGYKICIAKAQIDDPRLRYRQEVERCASRGEISLIGRRILDDLRDSLGILPEEAAAIETEVLRPYQEYKRKLQRYEQALVAAMQREHPLSNYTRTELKRYQEILKLRDEDIAPIESRIISREESSSIYQDTPITEPIRLEPKDVDTANETSSAIESNQTTKSPSTESLIDELSSKQRVNNTRPSASNPQSLFAKIAQTKNKLLAGGAILIIGLAGAGFQIYRQTTWRYAQLDNLLSAKKWKDADEETAQKMWEVAGRQKERMLRVEDFEKIPCEDLRTIDALWKKYSKENYGFTVQSRIWQSSDVNGDLGKFVARVGWGKLENNGSSFYYYLMDNIPFDLSQPAGHLPWAPTYYGGNHDTRKKSISRILDCEI